MKNLIVIFNVIVICVCLLPIQGLAGSAVTTENCLACKSEMWMEELYSLLAAGDTDNATIYLRSGKCIQLEKGLTVSISAYPTKETEIMPIDLLGDNLWSLKLFLTDFAFSEDEQIQMAVKKIKMVPKSVQSSFEKASCSDLRTRDVVVQYSKKEFYLAFKNQINQEEQKSLLKEIESYNMDVLNIRTIEKNYQLNKLECAGDLVSTENGEIITSHPITYYYEINKDHIQNVTVFGLPYRSLADSYAKIDVDCSRMELDGFNALAALASYFSEPSRTTAPTASELINQEGLTTTFPFKIAQAAEDFIVFVIDEKNICNKGSAYIVSTNVVSEWIE